MIAFAPATASSELRLPRFPSALPGTSGRRPTVVPSPKPLCTPAKTAADDGAGFASRTPAPPGNMLIGSHEQLRRAINVLEARQVEAHHLKGHFEPSRGGHQLCIRVR